METSRSLENIRRLLQLTVRSIFDTAEQTIILELLLKTPVLPVDRLAVMLGRSPDDVYKLCVPMEQAYMVQRYVRWASMEYWTSFAKLTDFGSKEYGARFKKKEYSINYRAFALAANLIISDMAKQIDQPIQESERKIYICLTCTTVDHEMTWSQLEVIDTWDPEHGFKCHRCSSDLALRDSEGPHLAQGRLNAQLQPFVELLSDIHVEELPASDLLGEKSPPIAL